MRFSSFIKALIPGFEKDRVLEDLRITHTELKEITLPAYETSVPFLKNKELRSKEVIDFDKVFRRTNTGFNKDLFVGIQEGLVNACDNLEVVRELIAKTYNEDVVAGGMTYLKANLLQFGEMVGFVSKYARKFLIYTFVMESSQYSANSLHANESLTKAEIAWIEQNFLNFAQAFKAVSAPKAKVTKQINDIPDIVIVGGADGNEDNLLRTHGDKVDPFAVRFIATWMNPIYFVRMSVAEWQVERYNVAKDELKVIQLRKLHLERIRSDQPDARLEKEISYLEDRTQKLNYKIRQMEESVRH